MEKTTPEPDVILDLKGEMCPVPLMNTMVTMKRLKEGQVLAVITNHVPSTRTIPENMQKSGYQVLGIEDLGEHTFKILIRR